MLPPHSFCVGTVEPGKQKWPSEQAPLHNFEDVALSLPYLPAGHLYLIPPWSEFGWVS